MIEATQLGSKQYDNSSNYFYSKKCRNCVKVTSYARILYSSVADVLASEVHVLMFVFMLIMKAQAYRGI